MISMHTKALRRGTPMAQLKREDFDTAAKMRSQMWFIYPFFGIHMLMFGLSGFFLAYGPSQPDLMFLYLHGGIAILVYLAFYLVIFGRDEIQWMFINAALGILGIYSQIGWILARFGKSIDNYPWYVSITPFLYYVLYTFLLRQFLPALPGLYLTPRGNSSFR